MGAIYNELDAFPAAWMRELIAQGHIAPGVVNERSIADLTAADVAGPGQRHFFAGIGVWSYALRLAGVHDDANIWTGSCPCQPFSGAGKRGGFDDERHLWPVWFNLIRECRPAIVFGEQVASPDGLTWLDAVSSDLEGEGYAFAAADLCAAGVGAPHIRQRLYFVAYASVSRRSARWRDGDARDGRRPARIESRRLREACELGHSGSDGDLQHDGELCRDEEQDGPHGADSSVTTGPTRGFWSSAEWIPCADGKYRPIEPGTFPLAHGAPARVGRLRGYGNAINAEQAAVFIEAALDAIEV